MLTLDDVRARYGLPSDAHVFAALTEETREQAAGEAPADDGDHGSAPVTAAKAFAARQQSW